MTGLKKKSYNAIFLEFYQLNGAVIDAIEYYLYMRSIGIDIKLCVYNRFNKLWAGNIEKLFSIIEDRYELDFDYKKDIIYYERTWDFIKDKYETVLILDRSTMEIYPLLNANKIIIFHDFSPIETTEELYNKIREFDHIKVYHEMPFAITKDFSVQTNLKMAFSLFKKGTPQQHHYFMNYLSKGDLKGVVDVLNIIPHWERLVITTNNKNLEMLSTSVNDERLVVWKDHPKDFFSKFGTYIYWHDGDYFDPRPRMFHECAFYGKKIIYKNNHNIKDGSWYRYNDVKDNPNAVADRTLTPDDKIIREFL